MELTRVYDTAQVDAYVAHLHQQIGALNDEIAALQDRLVVPIAADDTEAAERILGRVLLRAQQVADEIVADGRREREDGLAGAEHQRKELLETAERDAAAVTAEARRQQEAILEAARSDAAGLIAAAEEEARAIVARAEEAREMQALVDEVRYSEVVGDNPGGGSEPTPPEIVAFPWAARPGAPEDFAPPSTPPWLAADPPTGSPVIPLVGGGEPGAVLPPADAEPAAQADARRAFHFRR